MEPIDESSLSRIDQIGPPAMGFLTEFPRKSNQLPKDSIYESKRFPNIYYAKSPMNDLLNHRLIAMKDLNLADSRKSLQLISQETRSRNLEVIVSLFSETPTSFEEKDIIWIPHCLGVFCFFSCEDHFLPHCKRCNLTAHLTFTKEKGRLICSNPKCLTKVLAEFSFSSVAMGDSRVSFSRTHSKASSRGCDSIQQKADISQQQIDLIKKAAKRSLF